MADETPGPSTERTPLLRSEANDEDFTQIDRQVNAWKRRRWISFIASGLLIIVFVVLLVLSGIFSRSKKKLQMGSQCLTPACIHAASELLYNLSPDYQNIDACTSFDHLVCDGFNARHDIPADRSSYSTAVYMMDNGQTLLRHILESPYPRDSAYNTFSSQGLLEAAASADENNFNVMKEAYHACMDETTLKELGVQPLVALVEEVVQSFPAADDASTKDNVEEHDYAALSSTILLLEKLGVNSFEGLGAGADDKNPDVVIIQAAPSGLTLPSPEYYKDEKVLEQYRIMLEDVFGSDLVPSNTSQLSASERAKSVIDIEKRIASATPPPEDQQDVTKYYNIVKVAEAGKMAPALGLDSVIKALVPSDYTVDTMLLAFPDFLANVSQIVTESSKSAVQSYLVWHTIGTYHNAVEGPQVEPIVRFFNVLQGRDPTAKRERWKTCLSNIDGTLGWILSRFFIDAAFSAEGKQFGDHIVTDIKQQFITKLHALKWMDESVKDLAVNKVNNIIQKIGYPTGSPDITDPEALKDWYKGLEVTDSFFNNSISAMKFDVRDTWSALGKPTDRGRWGMNADTVNAYYNPPGNEIVFPAGIMQFPVFDVELPSYVSYGAFASVAGHELSHAFDSSGRHYDEKGNYTDWWTEHTVEEFQKRADCFVEQYGNFTVESTNGEPLHVNGRLTLGENIADAGGVAAAFAAWKERQAAEPDQDLPGLDYFSHDQLFFVFYANWWCGKVRKEQAVQYIYTDPHSPAFARILGTMANSRAFRESFNCPVKEPTCELW